MCTKACDLDGIFTIQKLAPNMLDVLAQTRLRCYQMFLPVGQKPAQNWSESQESHRSHQALWAIIATRISFRHRVTVAGLLQACMVGVEKQSIWSVANQCWSLYVFFLFHKLWQITEDEIWNHKSVNCLQFIKWHMITKTAPRLRKTS